MLAVIPQVFTVQCNIVSKDNFDPTGILLRRPTFGKIGPSFSIEQEIWRIKQCIDANVSFQIWHLVLKLHWRPVWEG